MYTFTDSEFDYGYNNKVKKGEALVEFDPDKGPKSDTKIKGFEI